MSRGRFHEELERLELELLTMGELAGRAVRDSVDALVERDDAKAMRVIAGDDEVDELYIAIDHGMLTLLALQAPVASDLRLISTIMHTNGHLERIADQAVNIAKLHQVTKDLPTSQTILQMIREMGDPLDRLNRHMHLEVAKLAEDPRALDWGMHMNMVARALERVGDNCVDIGEQVGFLVTGEFREFTDASRTGIVSDED
jgi:phosphate transport system protein